MAGGFVGTSGGSISDSYCTGLVSETTTAGAFVGSIAGGSASGQYFSIINGALPAVGTDNSNQLTAFDDTTEHYRSFVSASTGSAAPYDATLSMYYHGKYNLPTVANLGYSTQSGDFVAAHYGDWPAPEIFFFN